MTFDRDAFHRDAIQIPSHEDVTVMREFLDETLTDQGHPTTIDDAGNLLTSRGAKDNPTTHLVLNTHLDTVPPHQPYERDGDIVRGRGSCDAKGPLAAIVDAFCSANVTDGRVTLAVTPNEETSQRGGKHLADTLAADGYIVGEPTGLDVCPAARGNFGGHIILDGVSAHASDPTAGTNPLYGIGSLIEASMNMMISAVPKPMTYWGLQRSPQPGSKAAGHSIKPLQKSRSASTVERSPRKRSKGSSRPSNRISTTGFRTSTSSKSNRPTLIVQIPKPSRQTLMPSSSKHSLMSVVEKSERLALQRKPRISQ